MLERLKAAFTENLSLKLLSLAVALILFSLVHGGQDAQRTVSVGLVVLPPPENMNRVLTTSPPPEIRITLRGSRSVIDELRPEDLGDVQVDLRSGQDKRVVLEPALLHVPAGVRVDRFDPSLVEFAWEEQVVRDIPVQVGVVGTPAPGWIVRGVPSAEPKTVRVKGPKSEVLVLQHARADAFDVTGLSEGQHTKTLALDKPAGRVSYDVHAVTATMEIAREVAERSFTKLPVAVLGVPKGKTQPAEVDARLVCPPDVVHSLRAEQLVPQVHLAQPAQTGSESLTVELSVDKCEVQITPRTVVVRW
jgi:YbbR domain-containing protein